MKFTINLATRRYVNTRVLDLVLLALFVILGGLCLVSVREAAYGQAELTRLSQGAAAGQKPGGPTVSQAQIDALAPRIAFANALIDQKTVNWLGLLDQLESVVPAGVALTRIDPPKVYGAAIVISGVARDFNDLRALIENMERSKSFSEVFLLSQAETKVGQTQQGTNFTISCKVAYR